MTPRLRLPLAGVLVAGALVVSSVLIGSPAQAGNHNGSKSKNPNTNIAGAPGGVTLEALLCIPELLANGTGAALTKSITDVEDNGDGSYTIGYAYETNRPDGVYNLRDCAFKDTGGDGGYNALIDPVVGATSQQYVSVSGGEGTGEITVLAEEGDTICDRVVLSGTGPPNFTHRSNIVCVDLTEDEIPVGAVGSVGLVALSAAFFGVAYVTNKRRVRAARAVAPTSTV